MLMSNINLIIRNEKEKDFRTVEEVVRETFWNLYVPGCNEHFILHNLRNSSDFIPELDFVAEKEGQIAGQIVYSRGNIKYVQGVEKEVISFGPVSVLPAFQKQGIGSALKYHPPAPEATFNYGNEVISGITIGGRSMKVNK